MEDGGDSLPTTSSQRLQEVESSTGEGGEILNAAAGTKSCQNFQDPARSVDSMATDAQRTAGTASNEQQEGDQQGREGEGHLNAAAAAEPSRKFRNRVKTRDPIASAAPAASTSGSDQPVTAPQRPSDHAQRSAVDKGARRSLAHGTPARRNAKGSGRAKRGGSQHQPTSTGRRSERGKAESADSRPYPTMDELLERAGLAQRPALVGELKEPREASELLRLGDAQEAEFLRTLLHLPQQGLDVLTKAATGELERMGTVPRSDKTQRKLCDRLIWRLQAVAVAWESLKELPPGEEAGIDEELEQSMADLPPCVLNQPMDQLSPFSGSVVQGGKPQPATRPRAHDQVCLPSDSGSPIINLAAALRLEDKGAAAAMLTMKEGVKQLSSAELMQVLGYLELELMDTATRWTNHGLCVVVRRSERFCALARGVQLPAPSARCPAQLVPTRVRWVPLARAKRGQAVGYLCVPPGTAGAQASFQFVTACVNAQLLQMGVAGRVICDGWGEAKQPGTPRGTLKGLVAGLSPVTLTGAAEEIEELRKGVVSLTGAAGTPTREFSVPCGANGSTVLRVFDKMETAMAAHGAVSDDPPVLPPVPPAEWGHAVFVGVPGSWGEQEVDALFTEIGAAVHAQCPAVVKVATPDSRAWVKTLWTTEFVARKVFQWLDRSQRPPGVTKGVWSNGAREYMKHMQQGGDERMLRGVTSEEILIGWRKVRSTKLKTPTAAARTQSVTRSPPRRPQRQLSAPSVPPRREERGAAAGGQEHSQFDDLRAEVRELRNVVQQLVQSQASALQDASHPGLTQASTPQGQTLG